MNSFLGSTIGKKYLMGLTGFIWAGFVFTHMAGNLLIFFGPDVYNAYGHALTSGKIIYVAELILVLSILIHIYCAVKLTIENRKSKGSRYAVLPKGEKAPSLASQFMAVQGTWILIFIVTHLITFKYGEIVETTVDGVKMRDLFYLLKIVFKEPAYVIWYLASLVLLGFHLSHGVSSIFQSFGVLTKSTQNKLKFLDIFILQLLWSGLSVNPFTFIFHNAFIVFL